MENYKIIFFTAIIVLGLAFVGYSVKTKSVGGAYTYQNCNVTTTTAVNIDDITRTMLTATSGRTWARLQLGANETDNFYIMLGATATEENGIMLSSSTVDYIDIGFATDIPYSGVITGITDGTASSTLLITECR